MLLYSQNRRVCWVCFFTFKEFVVKSTIFGLLLVLVVTATAFSQGKGVDKQSERVRDTGSDRTPANNGGKQDTGAGRGFDFGNGRTPRVSKLPNPYRLVGRRDVIIKAVQDVMSERKLIFDEAASKLADGVIISQPFRFIKGAVITQSELSRYAEIQTSATRAWTQGRYTITVIVQPIDGMNANISVNAKVEGRSDGATGAEWLTLPSTGVVEDEFLAALIEAVTGTTPPGHQPATTP
jgi:hypothetical protein